jgi:uncharacterized membrane protein YfcA
MALFPIVLFAIAVVSGTTATVVGFGIGSLLTPLLAAQVGSGRCGVRGRVPARRDWRRP